MSEEIINRVAQSALITLNLEDHYHPGERILMDIKDQLFQGIILKEKDFRAWVRDHDWSQYQDKNLALTCSEDAIIPVWAWMLLVTRLEPYVNMVVLGDLDTLEKALYTQAIAGINPEEYRDSKVVIKGCSNKPVPEYAYVELTRVLRPVAASIMYGEPCSTVPLYKARK